MKRVTIPINGNIDSIRQQLRDEMGVDMSYTQIIDFLIKFYRKRQAPQTSWQKHQ